MQRNIVQDVNNFFVSVDMHFVDISRLYVHPKHLADIVRARETAKKLHALFIKALNATERGETVYYLMNDVYHPDYYVNPSAFSAPYSKYDNRIYQAFQDVIRELRDFVIFNTKTDKVYAAMEKWESVSKQYDKTQELDFGNLIRKLMQNVLDFARANAAKYVLPKDVQECKEGIVYLESVRKRLEQISGMSNLDAVQIKQFSEDALAKAYVASNKLFCDPEAVVVFGSVEEKSVKNHRILIEIIKGIEQYYSTGMQKPDLILNPMNKWYDCAREDVLTKAVKKIRSRFGQHIR